VLLFEVKPGEASSLDVHHGEEPFDVTESGTIELPLQSDLLSTGIIPPM
jgi:hypothetical protein